MSLEPITAYMRRKVARLQWGQLKQKSPSIVEYLVYDPQSKSNNTVTHLLNHNGWQCSCLGWINNYHQVKGTETNLQKVKQKKDCSHIIKIKLVKEMVKEETATTKIVRYNKATNQHLVNLTTGEYEVGQNVRIESLDGEQTAIRVVRFRKALNQCYVTLPVDQFNTGQEVKLTLIV
jgi:hypothetical protein